YRFDEPKAYRIVFRSPGFDDHIVRLNLENAKPQVVNVSLQADSATLTIDSVPAGAAVSVNGVPRGVTPCELPRLRQGSHTLELKLQGYHPYVQTVDVKAGEQRNIQASLQKLPAGLTIVSSQAQATVYVNGVNYGVVPVTLDDAVEGAYVVRVEKDGYKPIVRSVMLKSGATREERFDLEPQTGVVMIQTQPATVQVFVNGRRNLITKPEKQDAFTSAETALELPIGTYTVVFRADGYADEERIIQVKAQGNEPIRLRLNFKPNFEVRTETAVHRGVLVRQDADGSIALELRPGVYRTFTAAEIRSKRFWSEKNASEVH
ncbi:MAG: PEGA domain-containing protein, partial [Kiritimatiellae bacterium]|nr:PEGA domain-containing protein [Kiritimatiellia bacterium]